MRKKKYFIDKYLDAVSRGWQYQKALWALWISVYTVFALIYALTSFVGYLLNPGGY